MRVYYLLMLLLVFACSPTTQEEKLGNIINSELKYAKGFSMEHRDGKVLLEVYNPWNNYSLLARYELIKNKDSVSASVNTIKIPISATACHSSTYLGMLSMLDARNTVVATSSANWIYDSILYNRYLTGDIINLGNDMTIGAEAVISAQPDVVLKYIYQSADPVDPIIQKAGIPIVYIIEFMEEHPLGRAEWIKLVGALLGKEEKADSIFTAIENNYLKYTQIARSSGTRPVVLDGTIYKGTWYAAGGNSFVAQLLKDANADYFWFSDSTTGSLPLSFEAVIQNQGEADSWINANAFSLKEVLAIDPRCDIFKAYKNGNVFHYNKRINKEGGLDYYETGVVRPDLLLRDMLVILHPGIIDNETVYYKKLE